jgi:hypothetical protein
MSRSVQVVSIQPVASGTIIKRRFISEEEFDKEERKKKRKISHVKSLWRKKASAMQKQHGNTDFFPAPKFEHPGDKELKHSVWSFLPSWRQIDLDHYTTKMRIPGKPPSDFNRAEFQMNIEALMAVDWLVIQMQRMQCVPQFCEDLAFQQGRRAVGRDPFFMWMDVIQIYNGFVKTLQEMRAYVTPEQEASWRKEMEKEPDKEKEEEEEEEEGDENP